jgi:ABC-type Fe3+/spermidine/putrescine transport system ATPase subunit
MVQSYALFPHMSVAENVAFGLHHLPKRERNRRVEELLQLLGITELARRRPHQISGGQAQRVALARALAPKPKLLLLDEPFSALDAAIRINLRRELARLKRELDLTIVFVTHDLREAYNLADRIAVFDAGRVLQTGTLDDLFNRPISARVATLMEVRNIWRGRVIAGDESTTTVDTGRFILRRRGALAGR